MTAADVRTAIATAASGVTGIQCEPYYRQSLAPGDGMVRMDRMARDTTGFGFITTWQVWIALPQDVAEAETFLESRINDLLEAIGSALIVTGVRQFDLAVPDAGTIPVVVIEGNRPSDD